MSTRPRLFVVVSAAASLVVGLALGAGAVLAQGPSSSPIPPGTAGGARTALPAVGGAPNAGSSTVVGAGEGGSASGSAADGASIAYPFYAGTPGLAPDHTIVVTGTAQAPMKSDGSDRPAAQKQALQAALADAKSQAEVIAGATGLAISGVLSVSASVSPLYGYVEPMQGTAPTVKAPVSPQLLAVSVTVQYRVG